MVYFLPVYGMLYTYAAVHLFSGISSGSFSLGLIAFLVLTGLSARDI